MKLHEQITEKLKRAGKRYWANDNVGDFLIMPEQEFQLINETAEEFEGVLKSLLIDTETDPNSKGTAKRLAKMFWTELFSGRFEQSPHATAFPNEGADKYEGMLVIRSDIKSVCSHHWQPVQGTCFIGILPNHKVLGLSKYSRIVNWHARRGTLQEELCQRIRRSISAHTDTDDVAVYIEATHGCCENRGIMSNNSLTQTVSLGGVFLTDIKNKEEFFHNIKMQKA